MTTTNNTVLRNKLKRALDFGRFDVRLEVGIVVDLLNTIDTLTAERDAKNTAIGVLMQEANDKAETIAALRAELPSALKEKLRSAEERIAELEAQNAPASIMLAFENLAASIENRPVLGKHASGISAEVRALLTRESEAQNSKTGDGK